MIGIQGRLLHLMIHVGDLDRSVGFYTGPMGMRVLRRMDFPEEKRAVAFVGYGAESDTSVIELTYHYGVGDYDHGGAFGHIAIGVPDMNSACELLRAGGAPITREPFRTSAGTAIVAFTKDPDGYEIELVQRL